jgi:hypothetical protein
MRLVTIKSYVVVVAGGVLLVAAALLVVLQWRNPAQFNLYGQQYNVHVEGGRAGGGVNTALLMLCSAAGGAVVLYVARRMLRGVMSIRRARKAKARAEAPR